jgi:hypothetical protein
MSLVSLLLSSTGLFLLGVAAALLMAWSEGAERRLLLDRDDDDALRLAKAGLDLTYGVLPIVVAVVLQIARPAHEAGAVAPLTLLLVALGCIAYVALYAALIRPRMAKYRLARRKAAQDAASGAALR